MPKRPDTNIVDTADHVKLSAHPRGWKKYLGGKYFYFPAAQGETAARMAAWELIKRWDARPDGVETWEEMEESERSRQEDLAAVTKAMERRAKAKQDAQELEERRARERAGTKDANPYARRGDNGERKRLFLLLGLNCGFHQSDVSTLEALRAAKKHDIPPLVHVPPLRDPSRTRFCTGWGGGEENIGGTLMPRGGKPGFLAMM